MEPIKVEMCKPFGVKVAFRQIDRANTNNPDLYLLSVKDAIALSDELKNKAYEIIDEVNAVPVVPTTLKALIDLNKVEHLHYYKQVDNETTGLNLYRIKARFTDGSHREYYFECKFFEDKELRDMRMEYVKNIPIYINTKEDTAGLEEYNGRVGFNITPKEE